jgi:hypothetical protein
MPHLTVRITPDGAILDVKIGVSIPRAEALQKSGQIVPPLRPIRGLIDTGASCSAVDPSVLNALGLTPTGTTSISTPSTGAQPHICNQYDVRMVVPHPDTPLDMEAMPVIDSTLAQWGIQALIGRDVLQKCMFVYNGDEETFTLAF